MVRSAAIFANAARSLFVIPSLLICQPFSVHAKMIGQPLEDVNYDTVSRSNSQIRVIRPDQSANHAVFAQTNSRPTDDEKLRQLTDKAVDAIKGILDKEETSRSDFSFEGETSKDIINTINAITLRNRGQKNSEAYVVKLLNEALNTRYGDDDPDNAAKRRSLIVDIVRKVLSRSNLKVDTDYLQSIEREAANTRIEAKFCDKQLRTEIELGRIHFRSNSAQLDPGSTGTLNRIAKVIKECSKFSIVIEGHTDSIGSARKNKKLSLLRANAVMNYLHRTAGISMRRLSAIGLGSSKAVVPNSTPENRFKNRRIEFRVKF